MEGSYFVGQTATLTHAFSQADVEAYAALSGDNNPVHVDAEYAAGTRFGRRIVHGMLAASLFSTILGTLLPGKGALYLGQELRFKKPIFPDDELVATVELTAIREDKPIGTFRTTLVGPTGDLAIEGEAVLYLPAT